MKSIRVFLVTVILAVVTLFSFISALRGYETSLQEVERMFDSQLVEKAKLIANINVQSIVRNVDSSDTAFQVWQGGNLIGSSDNASQTILGKLQPGFRYHNFEGYRWRTYSYYNTINAQWIIVAARQDVRFSLAENIALKAVLPAVIGLPILAVLIWIVVSRGLHPMRRLAHELGDKQANDLSPLSIAVNSQELSQIVSSSNDLLARLKSSLLREKQFASDAAHELRTPISSLKVQLYNISQEQ
ncbi:MAG: two-component sensor histidine kinase, partial [Porticoccaceae bacterium]|nr:two-component sensor histidine kinase [Porticoccaceae bacterium]